MTDQQLAQMHAENIRRFETIESALATSREGDLELVASVARMEGAISTQSAMLDANSSRTRDELTVLFGRTREQGDKIENIRVDYVPRATLQRHEDQNGKEISAIKMELSALSGKVMKVSGAIALISAVLGWCAQFFGGR